jgi:hypothetical protein
MNDRTQPVNDDTLTGRLDAIERALTANTEILSDLADTVLKLTADPRPARIEQAITRLTETICGAVAEEADNPQADLAERFDTLAGEVKRLADSLTDIAETAVKEVEARRQTPTQ